MGNCKNNSNCGCDSSIPIAPYCNDIDCNGTLCSEVFCTECIRYCHDDYEMAIGDTEPAPIFSVEKGMNLNAFMQKVLVFMSDPLCVNISALDVMTSSITSSAISVTFKGSSSTVYIVEWDSVAGSGSQVMPLDTYKYTITGLVSNTDYAIKIVAQSSGCESVTLKVKTKS